MKTISRHKQKGNQSIKRLIRQLFELQIELELMNTKPHNSVYQAQLIIDSLDEIFERLIDHE